MPANGRWDLIRRLKVKYKYVYVLCIERDRDISRVILLHNCFFSILSAPPFDSCTSHRLELVTSDSVNEVAGRILIRPVFPGTVPIVKEMSVELFSRHPNDPIFAAVDVSFVQLQSCNLSVSYSDDRRFHCTGANRSGVCLVMFAVS
jgi:hypothetical protein